MKKKQIKQENLEYVSKASYIVLGLIREVLMGIDGKIDSKFLLTMIDTQFEKEHREIVEKARMKTAATYIG